MDFKCTNELASLYQTSGGIHLRSDDIKKITAELKSNCKDLSGQFFKAKYKYIKRRLYELNKKLDQYDNPEKNKMDLQIYESLNDIKQCYYLIDDIFDNYRTSFEKQIYTLEQKNEILSTLETSATFLKMKFFEDLAFVFKCL